MEKSASFQGLSPVDRNNDQDDVLSVLKRKFFSISEGFEFGNLMQGLNPFGAKNTSPSSKSQERGRKSRSASADHEELIELNSYAHDGEFELSLKGHEFCSQQLTHPTWCDECGDFIYGVYKQCLRCRCKYSYN